MSDNVGNQCRDAEQDANQKQADENTEQTGGGIARHDPWLHSDVCWAVHAMRVTSPNEYSAPKIFN